MTSLLHVTPTAEGSLIAEFFQQSEGRWKSERRYYTLPDGETKEVVSFISIHFLEKNSAELSHLAELHGIDGSLLSCGAEVLWDSHDSATGKPQSEGSTIFGASGATLYRDRGFATTKPVSAAFYFSNPTTLCLRTEYKGSVFEEELKLVGQQYRTRQTIISRAGEQQMIGQYLEKRL
ncbi:phycobiliprotein lyase [Stenomitos frigidus]|uniref:Chromophore lyase CpcS/CpeS n=1 Tax=Stenomitos frigidus ULC18 TaxID=2107698 RepID=A0A2T1EGW5_9CYAN|nr:phycobiliprotein lyase [Stenomitos frigidus]PSB31938.1 phycobiliprotein lyase [Stenomitos frigidus ULC18]